MMKRCETCKFAEWDVERVNCDGGVHDIHIITGCTMTASQQKEIEDEAESYGEPIPKKYDDRWGDTMDCPYWKEEM